MLDRKVGGEYPSSPAKPTVVILGARSEAKLIGLEGRLKSVGTAHVAIREPDAPYNGALMAIGLAPGEKADLYDLVKDFNLLRFDETV